MAETITHELALHGSDLDKIIKTYEKDGIEAVKKAICKWPRGRYGSWIFSEAR